MFIAAVNIAGHEQERQEGMRQQRESTQLNQLPQTVREKLQDDYEDWQHLEVVRVKG